MKKIIFILMIAASIAFTACNATTEVKILSNGIESETTYTFNDFFNPEELVHVDKDEISMAIVMDRNTGVIYVWKRSGYQWGMSPIYDADGSVLTYDKWFAKRAKKE